MSTKSFELAVLSVLSVLLLRASSVYGFYVENEEFDRQDLIKRWSTHSSYFNLLKSKKPWLFLPDDMCYHSKCEKNTDCCRRYNLCDRSAKVCIDCWYNYPCMTSSDCCEAFPACKRVPGSKYGRCVDVSYNSSLRK